MGSRERARTADLLAPPRRGTAPARPSRGRAGHRRAGPLALGLALVARAAGAADHHVDPTRGSDAGDGTADAPWRSLQAVIDGGLVQTQDWPSLPYEDGMSLQPKNEGAVVQPGDTIWLHTGDYGDLVLVGHYNAGPITLAAAPGAEPRFGSVLVRSSANWVLRGLTVSAEYSATPDAHPLVSLESHDWTGPVSDVTVERCTLRSIADARGWTEDDWNARACNGFEVDGARMTIRDNRLENVNFGISVTATDSLVEGNVVDTFAGDGLRGLGDRTTFQYNTVKNCVAVNANHDDGFQSWSVGSDGEVGTGEVTGIVLRGNLILNYDDPSLPFRGTLQGIGCFDGTYVDWLVENNVVITDHWHGITFLGARGVRVVNNTVLDLNDVEPGPPWIEVGDHKDGAPPVDCLVRNNLATAFTSADTVVQDHNLEITDPLALFAAPAGFDLHLLAGSAAVDAGSGEGAPALDRDRIPRPQGAGVDLGAYEWHEESVEPVAGAPGVGATGGAGPQGGAGAAGAGPGGAAPGAAGAAGDAGGCGCAVPRRRGAAAGIAAALAALACARGRRRPGRDGRDAAAGSDSERLRRHVCTLDDSPWIAPARACRSPMT